MGPVGETPNLKKRYGNNNQINPEPLQGARGKGMMAVRALCAIALCATSQSVHAGFSQARYVAYVGARGGPDQYI